MASESAAKWSLISLLGAEVAVSFRRGSPLVELGVESFGGTDSWFFWISDEFTALALSS